jgi:DNA (cytosine-5)-methyltransferase 1
MNFKRIKFIDLFAGVGGIRLGFERACEQNSFIPECVFTSEIDDKACEIYRKNFKDKHNPKFDITKLNTSELPDYDVLLAGFPCQAFSIAGKRGGFDDTRGTLFFDVARIIKDTRPKMFLLENVKGLTNHNHGKTFSTILNVLQNELNYSVHYKVLNAKNYGLPQNRERIYIVGFDKDIEFDFPLQINDDVCLYDIMENDTVDEKYYISEQYYNTLKNHKERHKSKGNGFGYEIRPLTNIANTIVCGGMGKERNLICDTRITKLSDTKNKDFIRKMTPLEWERLQGFPDNWTEGVADTHRYKQMGNSVAVNVIYEVCNKMIECYENR